jgi:hypothetical protein
MCICAKIPVPIPIPMASINAYCNYLETIILISKNQMTKNNIGAAFASISKPQISLSNYIKILFCKIIKYPTKIANIDKKLKQYNNYTQFITYKNNPSSLKTYMTKIIYSTLIQRENIDCIIIYSSLILRDIISKGVPFNQYTSHRLILIILMLSSKFCEDSSYSNKEWGAIGGISLSNINNMEKTFLELIDYKLFIDVSSQKINSISRCIYR